MSFFFLSFKREIKRSLEMGNESKIVRYPHIKILLFFICYFLSIHSPVATLFFSSLLHLFTLIHLSLLLTLGKERCGEEREKIKKNIHRREISILPHLPRFEVRLILTTVCLNRKHVRATYERRTWRKAKTCSHVVYTARKKYTQWRNSPRNDDEHAVIVRNH